MRMRRGHVVELLIVLALGMFAVSVNAQPDSWGMCRDGTVAQPIHAGEFLMLGDPRVEDWATRWRSFKSANPHLRLENDRISYMENDTRIPFRNDASLCGVSAAGYEVRPAQVVSHDDDPSLSPIHKAVHSVKSRPERIFEIGFWALVAVVGLLRIWIRG